MKKSRMNVIKRTLVGALALLLAISTPCVSLQAATVDPQFYSAVYKDVKAAYGTNANRLQNHYDVFGEKEGRSASLQDAVEKNDSRSLIIYYLTKNASYYRKNGLNLDFPFFNADNYLKANPDVAKAVKNDKMGALEHYLTYGAMEGRGSGTAFDPIVAIAARPSLGNLAPTQLLDAWTKAEGNASTSEYTLRINFNQNIPIKYTATKKKAPVASYDDNNETSGDSGDSSTSPVVEDKASFTLMVYLCGTDLESKEGNREATKALIKILLGAYEEENVNVMVLAGGTNVWKNDYFNKTLGASKEDIESSSYVNKAAMYTVNKAGLKAAVDALLDEGSAVKATTIDELYELAKDENKWESFDALANHLITADTLTLYRDLGKAKMGDSATLQLLLDESAKEFDSDSYALSLWNHGGGALEGVCFPDDETGGLEISEIKTALQNAGFGATSNENSKYKLGLLAFDACLMAGVETAAYLNDYYDMMYASEETTYGDVDYYHIIKTANSKASDEELCYWLALGIIEDRYANYKGLENALATGALFETGDTKIAINRLNNVAGILNNLIKFKDEDGKQVPADDTSEAILNAIKNARIKCEQIGNATTASDSKDYVDLQNFLELLKSGLENAQVYVPDDETDGEFIELSTILGSDYYILKEALSAAIDAAKATTSANVFNYGGYMIYNSIAPEVWFNEDFWHQIKNSNLCGASIYVPYFGAKNARIDSELGYFASNYSGLQLDEYSKLINSYGKYLKSDRDRIKNLAADLLNRPIDDSSGTAIKGYADILAMDLNNYEVTKDIDGSTEYTKMLTVTVKPYPAGTKISGYSSGDAFVDLFETMETLIVYITRQAQKIVGDTQTPVDIVVGSQKVSYENVNGMANSINIFTGQLEETDVRVAEGKVAGATETDPSQTAFDFVVPSDVDNFAEKDIVIETVMGTGQNSDKFMTVKGIANVNTEDADGNDSVEPVTVYHLFELSENGQYYTYIGSVHLGETVETSTAYINTEEATTVESISFYHQTIDTTNNCLVYAEEQDDVDGIAGAKVYLATETINIGAIGLNNYGKAEQNGYYFGIEHERVEGYRDIYVGPDVKDSKYETIGVDEDDKPVASDIFESIDNYMFGGNSTTDDDTSVTDDDGNSDPYYDDTTPDDEEPPITEE